MKRNETAKYSLSAIAISLLWGCSSGRVVIPYQQTGTANIIPADGITACTVGTPAFAQWSYYQPSNGTAGYYPMFKFPITIPTGQVLIGLNSSPVGYAVANQNDLSEALLLPSSSPYTIQFAVGVNSATVSAVCNQSIDYNSLVANLPAAPTTNTVVSNPNTNVNNIPVDNGVSPYSFLPFSYSNDFTYFFLTRLMQSQLTQPIPTVSYLPVTPSCPTLHPRVQTGKTSTGWYNGRNISVVVHVNLPTACVKGKGAPFVQVVSKTNSILCGNDDNAGAIMCPHYAGSTSQLMQAYSANVTRFGFDVFLEAMDGVWVGAISPAYQISWSATCPN